MTRISPFSRSYLRVRSTELMTDYCQILRPGPARVVYDPVTHRATNTANEFLYEGWCRLWEVQAGTAIDYQGGEVIVTQQYLSLPWDVTVPEPEDQVHITASEDASIVGRYFQIESITRSGGLRAARRMLVNAIDSPSSLW